MVEIRTRDDGSHRGAENTSVKLSLTGSLYEMGGMIVGMFVFLSAYVILIQKTKTSGVGGASGDAGQKACPTAGPDSAATVDT